MRNRSRAALHVGVHDTFRYEPFATYHTHVRSLTGVSPLVDSQRRSLGEAFSTESTYVRFLSSMNPFVLFELLFPREALRTYFTSERFISSVNSSVEFEFFFTRKSFPADITEHRSVHAVDVVLAVIVSLQTSRRGVMFVAYRAIVLD